MKCFLLKTSHNVHATTITVFLTLHHYFDDSHVSESITSRLQCPGTADNLKNSIVNCLKEHCKFDQSAQRKSQYLARILAQLHDLGPMAHLARQALFSAHNEGHALPPELHASLF